MMNNDKDEELQTYEMSDSGDQMEKESSPPKNKRFLMGALTGIFGTFVVCGLALVLILHFAGLRITIMPNIGKAGDTVLNNAVADKLGLLTQYIHTYFTDDVKEEDLANGLYAGLLESLDDKYSAYYTPKEFQDLQIAATQNYYGIGAALLQDAKTKAVSIGKVYEGTPAEKAGLKNGDIILKVDDIEADSMDVSELVTHIRGEEGTKVHLVISRAGTEGKLEFDVERANVDLPTVTSKMLDENVGYIRISEFGASTAAQFEKAAGQLKAMGMKSMILDVRDNPGGMVTTVTKILDDILPEGTVVYTQDKNGNRQDFKSSADTVMEYPIAVLMNGNSASASEILAGAIRDFKYGTLIGTTSFGKGIVQTIYPLDDGSAIKLTTAKYYTPNGENIQGKGIDPDITLDYEYSGDSDSTTYDETKDNQIQKAIEVLQGKVTDNAK